MRYYIAPLVLAALVPSRALAWTDAQVGSVAATVDVTQPELARVELELTVQVRSGWLSSLELFDLARDLELDPERPLLAVDEAGKHAEPELSWPEPGSLLLRWPERARAPQRGEHRVRVAYRTRQLMAASEPAPHGRRRLRFSLPRWPVRLSGVQIRVLGPASMTAHAIAEQAGLGEHIERSREGERSVLSYTRAELPRAAAYSVGFELPEPRTVAGSQQLQSLPAAPATGRGWALASGVLLGLLVLAKRRLSCRPKLALDALALATCSAAGALFPAASSLAIACALAGLSCALGPRREASAQQLASPPVRGASLAQRAAAWLRELGPAAWLDATTPPGLLALGGLALCALALAPAGARPDALACVWLSLPLFFTATRLHSRS